MHPKNQPPVFVPTEYVPELDRMTKACLMDLVWNLVDDHHSSGLVDDIMADIRKRAAFVVTYRDQQ